MEHSTVAIDDDVSVFILGDGNAVGIVRYGTTELRISREERRYHVDLLIDGEASLWINPSFDDFHILLAIAGVTSEELTRAYNDLPWEFHARRRAEIEESAEIEKAIKESGE
jgi:hypothetical protein